MVDGEALSPGTVVSRLASAVCLSWALLVAAVVLRSASSTSRLPESTERTGSSSCPPPAPKASRGDRRREEAALTGAVPDVIDLFAVAVASGLNARLALRAVADRAPPGPLAHALQRVEDAVTSTGARLADVIERLPDELGSEAVRPLVAAITDAERYGAALGPTLDRLADDARRTRQRAAEEAARRIPVKLLFPLVTCILPAFGLLTVAPLIAGGLRALRL